jgi:hypothetical protein
VAVAYSDEILRTVADRMVHESIGVLPVVEQADTSRLVGLITQFDLLQARQKLLEEERHAERVLTLRRAAPSNGPALGAAGRPATGRESDPNSASEPEPEPEPEPELR